MQAARGEWKVKKSNMRSMVATPDNRDLSNKEKELTPTHISIYRKKIDGQIKNTAKRVTDSTLPCYGAMVGKQQCAASQGQSKL